MTTIVVRCPEDSITPVERISSTTIVGVLALLARPWIAD
jgi:hypothetical protein